MATDLTLDVMETELVPDFLLDNTKVHMWVDG